MAFPEYFKATDVSEQSYQEELQRHRQEHSQEQAEALSDFHARQRSRSPLAAATAKAVPKAVSSSIPAAQRLQMGGSSSSSSGLRTSAGVRVGPPLTAAPAQIRSEKLQSGWAARFWEHIPGIFLFWLPKLFFWLVSKKTNWYMVSSDHVALTRHDSTPCCPRQPGLGQSELSACSLLGASDDP